MADDVFDGTAIYERIGANSVATGLADHVAAAAEATALSSRLDAQGFSRYRLILDVTDIGSATEITVMARGSTVAEPAVETPADWHPNDEIDSVDTATGISSHYPYQNAIQLHAGAQRRALTFEVHDPWLSFLIWADGADCKAAAYVRRID